MTPANLPHPPRTTGRPGTIRALLGTAGLVLLGVGTIAGLRMASAQDATDLAQQVPSDKAIYAMAELVAPPAPGSFAVADTADTTPDAQLTLASDSRPDCVKQLEQFLSATTVTFDQASAEISTQNVPLLTRISEEIMACDAAYVMVAGHADGSGEDAINLALSWERADRTLNSLLMLGVDPFAVEAMGFGARAPVAQGSDTDEGSDRRVDFRVMRKP